MTIDVSFYSKELRLSFHGSVSSCVGPILDVSMNNKLFVQQRYTIECFKLDIFLPSVYDTLFIVRSSSNLRDGTVVRYLHIRQYLSSLPFNDSYLLSFIHLMPANYSLVTANYSFYSTKISQEVFDINV
jgi:hypothetical protein